MESLRPAELLAEQIGAEELSVAVRGEDVDVEAVGDGVEGWSTTGEDGGGEDVGGEDVVGDHARFAGNGSSGKEAVSPTKRMDI
jgi:hypothetical protein